MAEKINFNNFQSVDRVAGNTGMLEVTPKDGNPYQLKENRLLTPAQLGERRGYNMRESEMGNEIPKDSWPEEEKSVEKKAKWQSLYDGLRDVTVLGDGEPLPDGRETYKTQEWGNVPKDEVSFEGETSSRTEVTPEPIPISPDPLEITPDPEPNPEIQSLQLEVKELREEVGRLTSLLAEALEQNKTLQYQLAEAKGETVDKPTVEQDLIVNPLEAAIAEFPIGKRVKVMHKGNIEEWAIAGKPEEGKNGFIEVLVLRQKGGQGEYKTLSVDQLRKWNGDGIVPHAEDVDPGGEETKIQEQAGPPAAEVGEEPPSRLRKVWEWMRHPVRKSHIWVTTRGVGRDNEGAPIIVAVPADKVPPNEARTYEEKRKSRNLLVAVPLGILAAYGLWQMTKHGIDVPFYDSGDGDTGAGLPTSPDGGNEGNHSFSDGSDHHHHDHDHDSDNGVDSSAGSGADRGAEGDSPGSNNNDGNGNETEDQRQHLDYWGPDHLSAVELPADLHLEINPDNSANLVDSSGNKIISNFGLDEQGNLSKDAQEAFRAEKFELVQKIMVEDAGDGGTRYYTSVRRAS